MPNLGIVVVTWNSARFMQDCLTSIPGPYHSQTIVIDNNSRDNTVELIRTGFPRVRLVIKPTNAGYARANNQGLAMLGIRDRGSGIGENPDNLQSSIFNLQSSIVSQYVLLLNPDTRLPPNAISDMLAYMEANPAVGALAPKLVNSDGSPQPSVRRFPTYRNMLPELLGLRGAYRMPGFDFNATQEVEQPMASCLLFRREVFEQVGLFDEQFPMYFNDVDLSRRIADAGWKTVYNPQVAVWHYRGGSTNQARAKMIAAMHRGLFRYFAKHDRSGWFWLRAVPLAIVIQIVALIRIIAWRVKLVRV